MKRTLKFSTLIFVVVILAACRNVTLAPIETVKVLPSPSPTVITPTSTPAPPSVPTLLPKEKESYLLNIIKTNEGCKLPCFLGIQPGISVWEDIRKIEAPLYFRESYGPDKGDSTSLYYAYLGKMLKP